MTTILDAQKILEQMLTGLGSKNIEVSYNGETWIILWWCDDFKGWGNAEGKTLSVAYLNAKKMSGSKK